MPTGIYPRKPLTQETKDRISARLKGRKATPEQIANMKRGRIGLKLSKTHRANIGAGLKKAYAEGRKAKPTSVKHMHTPEAMVKRLQVKSTRKYPIYSTKQLGSKNHQWRGGITPLHKAIRNTLQYKLWRTAVFERDNYTCQICGIKGTKLQADHIKRFAEYPELRFAIDNGRTLCEPCHRLTPTYGNRKQEIL